MLDERAATQRALAELDRQLDEFERAAEDVGGDGVWSAGGGVGEGEDDEDEEGDKEEVVDELNE